MYSVIYIVNLRTILISNPLVCITTISENVLSTCLNYPFFNCYYIYIILHYITLHYITLHYITLHYIILFYIIYCYVICVVLYCVISYYIIYCKTGIIRGSKFSRYRNYSKLAVFNFRGEQNNKIK